jgi:cytochrome bd ubiquinol oxidase subunit I
MLSMTLWLLTFLVPLQIFLGDQHGLNTAAHQPAKLAAIEARWDTQPSFPLTLFAIPDPANETNRYAIEVPYLGSLILTHSLDGQIKGLKEFKPEDRSPVAIPFFAFRIMVGIGFLMLAVVAVSWWLRFRHRLFDSPWFLGLCMAMGPLGFVAVLSGWTTTEVGRQPWTVYGLLRTADSTAPSLTGRQVLVSLLAYMVIYLIIYPSAVFIAARLVRKGPAVEPDTAAPIESGRPSAPVNVELVQEGKTL